MKAGWVALAALGLSAAGTYGAGAQGMRAQGASETARGLAVTATVQRPGAQLTGSAPPPDDGQGFAGADSAAGAADTLGQSATPATLPAGTFDVGNGISLLLNYTGQGAINPVGGIRQGSAWAGQLFFGLDADLKRLAGIDGASLHIAVTNRHGRSLSNDFIGNNTSVQEIYGGGQTTRLTLFSYQQKLFDDRIDIEVGRLVANIAFLNSPIYCNFQNEFRLRKPDLRLQDLELHLLAGLELGRPRQGLAHRHGVLPRRRLRGEPAAPAARRQRPRLLDEGRHRRDRAVRARLLHHLRQRRAAAQLRRRRLVRRVRLQRPRARHHRPRRGADRPQFAHPLRALRQSMPGSTRWSGAPTRRRPRG